MVVRVAFSFVLCCDVGTRISVDSSFPFSLRILHANSRDEVFLLDCERGQ